LFTVSILNWDLEVLVFVEGGKPEAKITPPGLRIRQE